MVREMKFSKQKHIVQQPQNRLIHSNNLVECDDERYVYWYLYLLEHNLFSWLQEGIEISTRIEYNIYPLHEYTSEFRIEWNKSFEFILFLQWESDFNLDDEKNGWY